MRFVFYSLLMFTILVHHSSAMAAEKDVVGDHVQLSTKDNNVFVEITTIKTDSDCLYKDSSRWGGDSFTPPKRVISKFKVRENKEDINIPLSAYADLGQPSHVKLEGSSSAGFQLIIKGSDAAGAYEATLEFKNHELSSRRVRSGEFPEELWEETRYKWIQPNEVE